MARRRLIWKVAPAYLLIIGVCTAVVAWFAGEAVRDFHLATTARQLERHCRLVAHAMPDAIRGSADDQVQRLCQQLGTLAGVRVSVIDPEGVVVADSQEDPAVMENHADRPEIRQAIGGTVGRSTRYSNTLKIHMMYVARPLDRRGRTIAVVRTAIALTDINEALTSIYTRIALGGVVMSLVAGVLTLFIFNRHVSRPLRLLQQGAMRFAAGQLDRPLDRPESQEIGTLAGALNTMAKQLNEKISTITHQSQERQAILASMIEGVLAVDAQGRVISSNSAVVELLNIDPVAARGRPVVESIRNGDLQSLISNTLASGEPSEGDVVIHLDGQDRFLQAQGTVLADAQGQHIGAVVVLHDVTRLRQLENIRQQFVANVSHELKTPITAIKAAVETVLDEPNAPPPDTERFMRIVARQADRLNAIVEDLLCLARIEQEERLGQMAPERGKVLTVLRGATETCQAQAVKKQIDVSVSCETDLETPIIAPLLEQAVVNLLDNAIKYSPEGGGVKISARRQGGEVVIAVADQGPGISSEHQPRLFDRFYRVDKARSRSLGGTGLGLAIVKHIANLHAGRVGVDSEPGSGAVFRICLPDADSPSAPSL